MQRLKFYLIFALIMTIANQQCSQTSQNDLLQTGSSFFYNLNGGVRIRQHLYQFPISYTPPLGRLQVIASSSNFQVSSMNGINFQIIGGMGQTSTYGVVVLLIGEDSSWTSVRVHYLVSSRNDFFLGSFSAGIYIQQKYSLGNTISVSFALPSWISSHQSFTAVAQISGLRTSASSFDAGIGVISFDPTNGLLISQLLVNSSVPIESIAICYIIFQNSAPFLYSSFNVISGSSATYQFLGIEEITNTKTVYYASGFTSKASTQGQISCIGKNCPAQCLTPQKCLTYSGIVQGEVCFICGLGQLAINGTCLSTTCGADQYFNGTGCSCYMGYLLVNSNCYQGCGPYAYINNSLCQCLPGYSYSPSTNNCIQLSATTCGRNYVLVENACVCPVGYGIINNLCVTCPANSYLLNGMCTCNPGSTFVSSTMTCNPDCFANSYKNIFGECVCNNGFYKVGNACISAEACVNGTVWNSTACVCPQGQVNDSITNQCTYCNTPDRMVSSELCTCSPAYYPTNVGCSPCPENSLYNQTSQICTCYNGYSMQNGKCLVSIKCPFNSFFNSTTLKCQCNSFQQYVINGFCQSCPLNTKWNGTACGCNPGFPCNCPPNSLWSGFSCVCHNGYFMFANTSCSKCDVNAVYVPSQQTCLCKAGWFGTFNRCSQCDSTCATCSGPGFDQCLTCPSARTINNGFCIVNAPNCGGGQYLIANSNICANCIANCEVCSDSSICTTCSSGYRSSLSVQGSILITFCQLIPLGTGSTLALKGQTTGNGVVYQGATLSLMPTDILAGGCSICNDLLKVEATSSFTAITATVKYIANSQYWFVVTFEFSGNAFIPTFQFNIQINPSYASYFSTADMAQILSGSGGSQPTAATTNNLNPSVIYYATPQKNSFTRNNKGKLINPSSLTDASISSQILVSLFS